jgi:hypothetical protein
VPPLVARLAFLPCLATALTLAASGRAQADGNLLAGASPSRTVGVSNVRVLTDGASAFEGEEWKTSAAAVFTSESSFVEFDLGRSARITAAYLQGDNNDQYLLSISEDHATFVPLWTAGPRDEAGLRERWTDRLSGHGRWVRLGVAGGDQVYSVSELQLFEVRPELMPPAVRRVVGKSRAAQVRTALLYLVAAFGVFLFLNIARPVSRRLWVIGPLLLLAAVWGAADAVGTAWPLGGREVSFIRAVSAAIALLAATRLVLPGRRWPPQRWAITAALGSAAVLAFAAFYNLGHPQFYDHGRGRPEFVHTYDMRVYQPFAKYFEELQYDGVYSASILAYAEDRRGGSLESLGSQEVRGLSDHRVRRVADTLDEIRAIRQRFTDQRWSEFKQDMRYFEDVLGPEFLSTLTDHGANATPVWVFFGRILLAHAPAAKGLLTLTGLVDGLLLILMALALWGSFGLWPTLLAVTVFGATDLYMFGTNWSGATLRHDWLALLGFGAAALKKEYWLTAGVCLGLSAMIRAFPALALIGVALPTAWAIAEGCYREGKLPAWRSVLREHPETVRVLGGAAACMLGMFLLTGLLYSFQSWANWWHKVTLLNQDVGSNEVSLRALIAGTNDWTGQVLRSRLVLLWAAQIGCLACVALAARRRPPHQAMLLALPLILVLSNPSNYYSHFVFLLALLAGVDLPVKVPGVAGPTKPLVIRFDRVAAPLLFLCIGGYWVSLDSDLDRHFQDTTLLLFLSLGWLYANLFRKDPLPDPSDTIAV